MRIDPNPRHLILFTVILVATSVGLATVAGGLGPLTGIASAQSSSATYNGSVVAEDGSAVSGVEITPVTILQNGTEIASDPVTAGSNGKFVADVDYINGTEANVSFRTGDDTLKITTASDTATTFPADDRVIQKELGEQRVTLEIPSDVSNGLTVDIEDTNAPITASETLTVEVTATNDGESQLTQDISLLAPDGSEVDNRTEAIAGESSERFNLTWNMQSGISNSSNQTVTVRAGESTATETVQIRREDTPPTVGVKIEDTNAPINAGETLAVQVRATNNGESQLTQEFNLTSPGGTVVDTSTKTVPTKDSETFNLSWDTQTGDGESKNQNITVHSGDSTATESVQIHPENDTAVESINIDDTNAPIDAGETLVVQVTATNDRENQVTKKINLTAPNRTGVDSVTETIAKRDSETLNLSWNTQTGDGEPTNQIITVHSGGSTATKEVQIRREDDTGTDIGPTTVSTQTTQAPDCDTVTYSGSGTSGDPYIVNTIDQLQCIPSQGLSAVYKVTSDIDAKGTVDWNDNSGFDPIGSSTEQFTGTFDGNGHEIEGLTINRGSERDVGLFGNSAGTIRDVSIIEASIIGDDDVGTVVGDNNGEVNGTAASGDVSSSDLRVGGLVGRNDGRIEYSNATVDVSNGDDEQGGLVGRNAGSISHSYATGAVADGDREIGGLVGYNTQNGGIALSYATGTVTGNDDIGGLVGENDGGVALSYALGETDASESGNNAGLVGWNDDDGTITLSYAAGVVQDSGGGLVERNDGTILNSYWDSEASQQQTSGGSDEIGLTTSEMTGESAPANIDNFDFSASGAWQTQADGYPILTWQQSEDSGPDPPAAPDCNAVTYNGSGTSADPYIIGNIDQLQCIQSQDPSATYQVTSNIDAKGTAVWNDNSGFDPIGSSTEQFTGTFDGNGHEIEGLTINR